MSNNFIMLDFEKMTQDTIPKFLQSDNTQILKIKFKEKDGNYPKNISDAKIEYTIVKPDNKYSRGIFDIISKDHGLVAIRLSKQQVAIPGTYNITISYINKGIETLIPNIKYEVEENKAMNLVVSANENNVNTHARSFSFFNNQETLNKWWDGAGIPDNNLGNNGDYYLQVSNGDIFKKQFNYWERIGNIAGKDGEKGNDGQNGLTPELRIGRVSTSEDGISSVTNVGTVDNPVFDFVIPKGNKGDKGNPFTYEDFTDVQLQKLKVKGDRGSLWYDGVGLPPSTLGTENDYFLSLPTGDFYKKISSVWERRGSLLSNLSRSVIDTYSKEEIDDMFLDKVDKVTGKNLSSNDFTDECKNKLEGLQNADVTRKYVDDNLSNKSNVNHDHNDIYASKTNEHTHSNKDVLDTLTVTKINNWDNKSDFDGDYNSLKNQPIIPSIDVTKSYVDTNLMRKSDIGHKHNMSDIEGLDLSGNVDLSNYYTSVYIDNNFYNKGYTNDVENNLTVKIASKADKSHDHNYNDLRDKPVIPVVDVNRDYVDKGLNNKSNIGHSHNEYLTEMPPHRHNASEIDGLSLGGGGNFDGKFIPRITNSPDLNEIFIFQSNKAEFKLEYNSENITVTNDNFTIKKESASILARATKKGVLSLDIKDIPGGYYYIQTNIGGTSDMTGWQNDIKKHSFDVNAGDTINLAIDTGAMGLKGAFLGESKNELRWNSSLGQIILSGMPLKL